MLISAQVMGWVGVILYLYLMFSFRKMAKRNEFAFLHIILAFIYAMWIPLPLAFNKLLDSEFIQVGNIFGLVYLVMILITMTLQAGHISYIVKQEVNSINENFSNYLMATLSAPFESFANILRCIWALFIGISFVTSDEILMASLMFFYSLLIIYYVMLMLNTCLVKGVRVFSKFKPNFVFTNLETFIFFIILICYMSFTS
ncbi:MAG TPA: hypothetical protein VNR38_20320 [Ureibacillus sp.]|nr:hypothetical protein [Ureibacillus sp.]